MMRAALVSALCLATAESWSTPDDTGCTALQALCGNSSLHQAALEVALEHATSSSCWLVENAATWQTAMHLLCASASGDEAERGPRPPVPNPPGPLPGLSLSGATCCARASTCPR